MYDSAAGEEDAPEKVFNQLGVLGAAPGLHGVAPPNRSLASAQVSVVSLHALQRVRAYIKVVCITRPT